MTTSTNPEFLILPVRAKTFVPLVSSVPIPENHSPPLLIITGILANVSTLFIIVGSPHTPFTAGNGGLGLGIPRSPSIDSRSAVSSPQTNAPAPNRISISKLKSLPRILSPKKPSSLDCFIAVFSLLMAKGYSARI